MKEKNVESNVWKIFFLKASLGFTTSMSIIVLFFQENGLTLGEVFKLQALFSVVLIVLEIPSGYFSDAFGRRHSMIIGSFFVTVGFSLYSLVSGFWQFLVAEIILAIGVSFISGTDSALLYDTLLQSRRIGEYTKLEGRAIGLGLFTDCVASIIGGFLAIVSLRLPLFVDALVSGVAIPVAFMLVEPEVSDRSANKVEADNFWQIIFLSFKKNSKNIWKAVKFALVEKKQVRWIIFFQPLLFHVC
jgi:MFS family permease